MRGATIHSGVSSGWSSLRFKRDRKVCRLGVPLVVCQCFSSSARCTAGSGSRPKFVIAAVAVSAPVPSVHEVRAQSHVKANEVQLTVVAPATLGLTRILRIGRGVVLVSSVASAEIRARRATDKAASASFLRCSFVPLSVSSSFCHSFVQVLRLDRMSRAVHDGEVESQELQLPSLDCVSGLVIGFEKFHQSAAVTHPHKFLSCLLKIS